MGLSVIVYEHMGLLRAHVAAELPDAEGGERHFHSVGQCVVGGVPTDDWRDQLALACEALLDLVYGVERPF